MIGLKLTDLVLTFLGVTTVGLYLFHKWQQSTRRFKLGNKIDGPKPLPVVGNLFEMVDCKTPYDIMQKLIRYREVFKDTQIVRAWIGSRLVVGLNDPADVELILNSPVHLKKPIEYQFFKPWLGDGLLISSGEKWRTHRKVIAPTFHLNILKSFVDVFNRRSRAVVDQMKKEVGKEFDVHDYMSGTTVDILLESVMGIRKNDTNSSAGFDYAMAVMKLCEIIQLRQAKILLRNLFLFKFSSLYKVHEKCINIIHSLTTKVVKQKKDDYINTKKSNTTQTYLEKVTQDVEDAERIESLQKDKYDTFKGINDDLDDNDANDIGQKKRLAFLDFMIEASQTGSNISDLDIKEEVDTIMFEGHDTTAAGSSFFLCMMGVHQQYQQKVYDEIHQIFGDSNRPCTFNDTLEMKLLERCLLETLRMYPPVPLIARYLDEDVQLASKDIIIPAGTTVGISQYFLHRNPEIYPNPHVFNPDNFLPENCQKRHYYAYIPFSAGPRSCVGRKYALLKLKVLLSTILRNFKVYSDVPEKDFQLQADIILKRTDGFRIRLEPRLVNEAA